MAKRISSALLHFSLLLFTFSAPAAIPVRWTVDTFRVKPLVYECYHGETLDLAAAMTAYGDPLDLSGKTARLYWQTNGMDAVYWSTNATVSSVASVTNVLSAIFSGSFDPGAPSVSGFIGVEGENYRAAFQLNFRASPGFSPAHLPIPTPVIDFATTAVANPEASPFMVKGGSGVITAQQAGTIATNTVDAKVAPWAMSGQPKPSGGGITTNDVNAIIASSNLCTVAAAEAMTNAAVAAAKTYADDNFLPSGQSYYEITVQRAGNADMAVNATYAVQAGSAAEAGSAVSAGYADHIQPSTWSSFKALFDSDGEHPRFGQKSWSNPTKFFAFLDELTGTSVTNGGAKAYADATFAPKLTGRTYDFANGSNFTLRVYTAITNVIQTLGGTVTNPPTFN